MNEPYTDEDYKRDLLIVMRDTPEAGAARARIQHYEHGRDPYNLKSSGSLPFVDNLFKLVGWGVAIFILLIIISITTGWF